MGCLGGRQVPAGSERAAGAGGRAGSRAPGRRYELQPRPVGDTGLGHWTKEGQGQKGMGASGGTGTEPPAPRQTRRPLPPCVLCLSRSRVFCSFLLIVLRGSQGLSGSGMKMPKVGPRCAGKLPPAPFAVVPNKIKHEGTPKRAYK